VRKEVVQREQGHVVSHLVHVVDVVQLYRSKCTIKRYPTINVSSTVIR